MSHPEGQRVTDTREGLTGTIGRGGSPSTRLVHYDDGGTEYVHVDHLTVGDAHAAAARVDADLTPTDAESQAVAELGGIDDEDGAAAGGADGGAVPPNRRRYTDDEILDAIHRWHAEHGEPPRSGDWRRLSDEHPSTSTVKVRFGSWANAIEAAGFPRPKRGVSRPPRPTPAPEAESGDPAAAPAVEADPVDDGAPLVVEVRGDGVSGDADVVTYTDEEEGGSFELRRVQPADPWVEFGLIIGRLHELTNQPEIRIEVVFRRDDQEAA